MNQEPKNHPEQERYAEIFKLIDNGKIAEARRRFALLIPFSTADAHPSAHPLDLFFRLIPSQSRSKAA